MMRRHRRVGRAANLDDGRSRGGRPPGFAPRPRIALRTEYC